MMRSFLDERLFNACRSASLHCFKISLASDKRVYPDTADIDGAIEHKDSAEVIVQQSADKSEKLLAKTSN